MTINRSDHASYRSTAHFGSLDGLRFLCISAVLWHHLPFWRSLTDTTILASRGHVGVDFFFVLSGFLITTLLLREEKAKGRFSLRAFYWRRILRIVPIYFLVVTVAGVYAIGVKGRGEDLALLPYYYLFLSNFLTVPDIGFLSPTWSLSMEEQFYMIWPALLLLLPRRWIVPVLIALVVINVTAATGAFSLIGITGGEVGPLRFALSGTTYAPLLLGALAALVLDKPKGFAAVWPLCGFRAAPWVWFALLLTALAGFPGVIEGLPNLVVHTLMTLMLISLVQREDNAMAWLLRQPPIARIGQISYGIYLYHLFALVLAAKAAAFFPVFYMPTFTALFLIFSVLMAEISSRTFEAWSLRFRHKVPGQRALETPGKTT